MKLPKHVAREVEEKLIQVRNVLDWIEHEIEAVHDGWCPWCSLQGKHRDNCAVKRIGRALRSED